MNLAKQIKRGAPLGTCLVSMYVVASIVQGPLGWGNARGALPRHDMVSSKTLKAYGMVRAFKHRSSDKAAAAHPTMADPATLQAAQLSP